MSRAALNEIAKEIKSKLTLSEEFAKQTKLKATGHKAHYMAICPFHDDTTESLSIDDEKGVFKCHGCNARGDVISFHALKHNIGFAESIKDLARQLQIPTFMQNDVVEQNDRLLLSQTRDEYHSRLKADTQEARAARDYLVKERGLTKDTIEKFGIGLGPIVKRFSLSAPTESELRAGIKSEKGWDYMSNRIVLPILNGSGECIGFGGRKLDDESDGVKYINTPSTPYFSKADVLFGLHEAKRAIARSKKALIVEGYMDVVTLHQNDIDNCVGVMGVTLSAPTIRQIWRYADEIILCLDGDMAGESGVLRSILEAAPHMTDGKYIRVLLLPDGLDPDEFVTSRGAAAFTELMNHAIEASSFLVRSYMHKYDMHKVEGRAAFMDKIQTCAVEFKNAPHFRNELLNFAKRQSDLKTMASLMRGSSEDSAIVEEDLIRLKETCEQLLQEIQSKKVRTYHP